MSNEATLKLSEPDIGFVRAQRAALRMAFGVTACFAFVKLFDWDATFIAPMLAASMLVKPQPPNFRQGLLALVVIAASTLTVLVITAVLLSNATALIMALLLLILIAFYAHRRGAPDLPTLMLQISAVAIPTIAIASPDGAGGFAAALLVGGMIALLSVWAAHWAFPAPMEGAAAGALQTASAAPPTEAIAGRHALLDTLVVLPILVWFILDASQLAVVILVTILTILRNVRPEQGQRAALGLIVGNFVGGAAAAIAYNILSLSNTLLSFVIICLTVSLIFAGRIVTAGDRAPIYAIGFSTFILLLGLGISPLPGGSGEAFASRLLNVMLASAYAIGALSLLTRWRPR
jgi:hypothetical protein